MTNDEYYSQIKNKMSLDRTQKDVIFLMLHEAEGGYVPSNRFRNISMSHRKCISTLNKEGFNIENKRNMVGDSWHSSYRLKP